jgi:hypothetical protein
MTKKPPSVRLRAPSLARVGVTCIDRQNRLHCNRCGAVWCPEGCNEAPRARFGPLTA